MSSSSSAKPYVGVLCLFGFHSRVCVWCCSRAHAVAYSFRLLLACWLLVSSCFVSLLSPLFRSSSSSSPHQACIWLPLVDTLVCAPHGTFHSSLPFVTIQSAFELIAIELWIFYVCLYRTDRPTTLVSYIYHFIFHVHVFVTNIIHNDVASR